MNIFRVEDPKLIFFLTYPSLMKRNVFIHRFGAHFRAHLHRVPMQHWRGDQGPHSEKKTECRTYIILHVMSIWYRFIYLSTWSLKLKKQNIKYKFLDETRVIRLFALVPQATKSTLCCRYTNWVKGLFQDCLLWF